MVVCMNVGKYPTAKKTKTKRNQKSQKRVGPKSEFSLTTQKQLHDLNSESWEKRGPCREGGRLVHYLVLLQGDNRINLKTSGKRPWPG